MLKTVTIIVGAQWGDEGKGKWIDILAPNADVVCRFQGGNNAGHTLYVKGEKVVLHQIPSGIFHPDQVAMIGAGVVVNPVQLLQELDKVKDKVTLQPENFWISEKAHCITPWHVYLDTKSEENTKKPIGTTKRGIGPTYADKINRIGLKVHEFVSEGGFSRWLNERLELQEFRAHYEENRSEWNDFAESAKVITPFVRNAEEQLRKRLRSGSRVLIEGAQGTLLDINHGTYPYVTSSSTIAGGAIANLGIGPTCVDKVIGIAKAYTTRVGEGPFPTELHDDVGATIGKKGHEFGATTSRPRRCGWFDAVAMRYACQVNGFESVYLNKMDVLSGFAELKIAISYSHPTLGELDELPSDPDVLIACTPNYISVPGWQENLEDCKTYADLPANAKAYVTKIESLIHTRVGAVGNGPGREDFLMAPQKTNLDS